MQIRIASGLVSLFAASVAMLVGCGPAADAAERRLVVTGSSTVAPLAAELGRLFEAQRAGVRIDVQSGGSSRGIADVRRGLATLGMVSRALHDEEADCTAHPIARDAVGVIVHADNPVAALELRRVVELFTGQVREWRDVGWQDGATVVVVQKAAGRATLEVFSGFLRIAPDAIRADVVIGDNQQGIQTVAANRHSIGYVSIGAAEAAIAEGASIRILPLADVARDAISRPLSFVTVGEPDSLTREFLDFARSPIAHDVIRGFTFVPTGS